MSAQFDIISGPSSQELMAALFFPFPVKGTNIRNEVFFRFEDCNKKVKSREKIAAKLVLVIFEDGSHTLFYNNQHGRRIQISGLERWGHGWKFKGFDHYTKKPNGDPTPVYGLYNTHVKTGKLVYEEVS